jgi:DNA topoisomerase 2-associated protein PAT1
MSFFGFDTTLPRDRGHQKAAPGFAAPQDAFASLSSKNAADDAYVNRAYFTL